MEAKCGPLGGERTGLKEKSVGSQKNFGLTTLALALTLLVSKIARPWVSEILLKTKHGYSCLLGIYQPQICGSK